MAVFLTCIFLTFVYVYEYIVYLEIRKERSKYVYEDLGLLKFMCVFLYLIHPYRHKNVTLFIFPEFEIYFNFMYD